MLYPKDKSRGDFKFTKGNKGYFFAMIAFAEDGYNLGQIIWHPLTKYIGPYPSPPPHTNVDNVMQNTVCKPLVVVSTNIGMGGGGGGGGEASWKNLIFITQTIRASHFPNEFCPRLYQFTPLNLPSRETSLKPINSSL